MKCAPKSTGIDDIDDIGSLCMLSQIAGVVGPMMQ